MNGFVVFDFADKMDVRTMLRIFLNKELSQWFQVIEVPGKWDSNVIHFMLKAKINNIVLIILVNGRQWYCDPWQTHIFLLSQFAFVQDVNNNDSILLSFDYRRDATISEEDFVANVDWFVKVLVRTSNSLGRAEMCVVSGEFELLVFFEIDGFAVHEVAGSDLWAFGVQETWYMEVRSTAKGGLNAD